MVNQEDINLCSKIRRFADSPARRFKSILLQKIRLSKVANHKSLIIIVLCLKLLLDPFLYNNTKAEELNDINLLKLESKLVSFNTFIPPSVIALSSLPVSYNISSFASAIKLSSVPVSFNTSLLPSLLTASSKPVSYSLSQTAAFLQASSLPVSYSLNIFSDELIKTSSKPVAFKTYNGVPVLSLVSPNLLPLTKDTKAIDVSVSGENFVKNSKVSIGTLMIDTKYISQKELIATIPANYLLKENNFEIYVANPPPNGGVSQGFNVMVVDSIPIAKINAIPNIGVAPQVVTFDGHGTEDLLAKYFGEKLSYEWEFGETGREGDGVNGREGENTSTNAVAVHTYKKPGKYLVSLNVTNAYGKTSKVTKEIEIREKNESLSGTFETEILTFFPPNNLPIVQLSAVPQDSTLKLNKDGIFTSDIQFISNGTSDLDGEVLVYNWNFGDGETSSELNLKHEYKNPGSYIVKLTATDTRGGTREKEIKVNILKPKPVIGVQIDRSTGIAPFEVTFDARSSYDYDGRPVSIKFDFGDNSSETLESTNAIVKHTYTAPGTYLVTLSAVAPDNRFSIINPGNIIVGPNNAPIGVVTKLEGENKGIVDKAKIKLSAKGSFDPINPNSLLKYKWLWNAITWDASGNLVDISKEVNDELTSGRRGDGANESNNEEFEYTFTEAGQFTPVLEIETADGTKSKFFGETFTISNEQAPVAVARIISEKTEGNIGLEVSFDGSGSYDPKANGRLKILTWDFGDGEKSTEVSPKHIYNKEGTFTPTLVVVDNENNIGLAQTASIKVTKASSENNSNLVNRKILFQIADEIVNERIGDVTVSEDEAINSMIKEALSSFASIDNQKPEIGPINIEPKTIRAGDVIKLSASVKDNIAVSNFGYILVDSHEEIIAQKVIDLINNEDKILKEETYIEEEIFIPKDLLPGTYKIKLTATDTNGNQVAQIRGLENQKPEDQNEEISVTFEVTGEASNAITPDTIIEPSSVVEGETAYRSVGVTANEKDYNTIVKNNNQQDSFIRGRNIINTATKDIRLQQTSFEITNLTPILNPYYPTSPSMNASLYLDVLGDKDGYIEITSRGSLPKEYLSKWYYTTVYVNDKYIGWLYWYQGAGLSFTSNISNQRAKVEFRPYGLWNGSWRELPQSTWRNNYFTFTKIIKPEITNISPNEAIGGRGAFDLVIYGNNFRESSRVYFDGNKITPSVANSNYLQLRIPASLVSYTGVHTVTIRNQDNSQSNIFYFATKPNTNNPCNLTKTLPQRYYGADSTTILTGNNVYLSFPNATIQGNGSVIIPFCTNEEADIKTSLRVHHENISGKCNILGFRIGDRYIGGKVSCKSETFNFENLNTSSFTSGLHNLEVSFSAQDSDRLVVEDATFSNGGGPILESIHPKEVNQYGNGRTLKIHGKNFDKDTQVYFNDTLVNKQSYTQNEIVISLPDSFTSTGAKNIKLTGNNKASTITSLLVKNELEIVSDSFKVTPVEPFPGNSFNIELAIKTSDSKPETSEYIAYIGIFDKDGKLLTIPNISNHFSTFLIKGQSLENQIAFSTSIPLDINIKPGNYTTVCVVERSSSLGKDYSNLEALNYLTAMATGLSALSDLVPLSHKLTFTPKPAVVVDFGIEENTNENIGFIKTGNKIIQDGQSIKYKARFVKGEEYKDKIKFNFKSTGVIPAPAQAGPSSGGKVGIQNKETGLTSSDSATFTYENKNTSSSTPLTYMSALEVFWIDDTSQTKLNSPDAPTISVYPNFKPIAKARVLSENYPTYATNPPLVTAFVDNGSYDPNQTFSSTIDYVDSKQNNWTIYKGTVGPNENIISAPIDSKISDDKKTFLSGSLFTPGTYFAKLTVYDQAGLTDTASTESVTVTYPHQKLIVYATTDPSDKKVYDPSSVIPVETEIQEAGIPIAFKSEVTVLTGSPILSYRWDFGDSSCHSHENGNPEEVPSDCTSVNPTHYYFDGKRSFDGKEFTDRKSITPKLTVKALWPNGQQETWEASAGTITFNKEPNFVALDVKADKTSGIVPLTIFLMIDPFASKAVNATVTRYEIDWGDNVIPAEAGIQRTATSESGTITFSELINKTFTHTYLAPNTYSPKLTVYIKESNKPFVFNAPQIAVSGAGQGGIYLLDDLSTLTFTNEPIATFKILANFPNPLDMDNSLKIKVKDSDENESVTELEPGSSNQTISLSEGKNSYYFEISDSTETVIKSKEREIILDTIEPAISRVSALTNSTIQEIVIKGEIIERNLEKVELVLNDGVPLILSSGDVVQAEDDEYLFAKTLENISDSYHTILIRAYDLAGNISETTYEINKQNNTATSKEIDYSLRTDFKSPQIVSNYPEHIYGTREIERTVISGEPFKLDLKTCFSDDTSKHDDRNVSANFEVESHKVEVSKNNSDFKDITKEIDDLVSGYINRCVDIQSYGIQYRKLNCTDSGADISHCKDACTLLNGHICNVNVFSISQTLNQFENYTSFFNPENNALTLTKQWDVGHYKLKLTLNENPDSCFTYGTCLGKNPDNQTTSETYTYTIDVVRQPEIIYPDSSKIKLLFNENNEVTFKFIAMDNLSFTGNRKVALGKLNWTGLQDIQVLPQIEVTSEYIDSDDPRNYIFNLKAKANPDYINKLKLTIPVIFPPDYFNLSGISKEASFTFNIDANFGAEIISPASGTLLSKDKDILVTSKVTKPEGLNGTFKDFNNCGKSTINYEIKTQANETKTLEKLPPKKEAEKIASLGIDEGSIRKFTNKLNFDLKNISKFTKDFLNGDIFGPIELRGTYSTLCNSKNILFDSEPKTYILLDNPKIVKGKCRYPNGASFSRCEITTSNNTFFDDYDVIVTPEGNNCIPKVESKNKLTRKYLFDCLPKDVTNFEVKIKRNIKFLDEVQKRINDSLLISASITTNEDTIFADRKHLDVKNIEKENTEGFKIGDEDNKIAVFNGKTVSVRELKDLLYDLGLITYNDWLQTKYTKEINDAFWKLTCIIDEAKGLTLDPNLRLQTIDNPIKCTVSYDESPDIKYIEDVSIWIEVISGLKARVGEDLRAYINPAALGTIAAFIAWNAILPVNAWILLVAGVVSTEADITTRINEVKDLWNNSSNLNYTKTSYWKTGYTIGTLLTAVPGLIPANVAKNVDAIKVAAKLDDYTELQNLILSEQRLINELQDTVLQTQRQEGLNNFATIVEKLNQSGKKVLDDVVKRFIERGFDKFLVVRKLGLVNNENKEALVKVINRDQLAIGLIDKELNDLVFVVGKNVDENRVNVVVDRVANNLISGKLSDVPIRGIKFDLGENVEAVRNGERSLANLKGETFFTKPEDVIGFNGKELLQKLGLDTLNDVKKYCGKELKAIEFDLSRLETSLPISGNESFVKGGITAYGIYEGVVIDGKLAIKSANILSEINGEVKSFGKVILSENDIRQLLNQSLNPLTIDQIDILINSLKIEGRL